MDTPIQSGTAASERVLKTASELFAAEGLYQVGVNRIIDEAGVAKATPLPASITPAITPASPSCGLQPKPAQAAKRT